MNEQRPADAGAVAGVRPEPRRKVIVAEVSDKTLRELIDKLDAIEAELRTQENAVKAVRRELAKRLNYRNLD